MNAPVGKSAEQLRFEQALAAFARAAVELHDAWDATAMVCDTETEDVGIDGYPSQWESFDDEVLHITEWARKQGVRP